MPERVVNRGVLNGIPFVVTEFIGNDKNIPNKRYEGKDIPEQFLLTGKSIALENKNRVVRTKDSEIAFIGHGLASDGDILFKGKRDMQTNEVKFIAQSKARYGIDYVEANEELSTQIDPATALIEQQQETGLNTVDQRPIFNEDKLEIDPDFKPLQDPWIKAGFASKEAWKAAGKPEFRSEINNPVTTNNSLDDLLK